MRSFAGIGVLTVFAMTLVTSAASAQRGAVPAQTKPAAARAAADTGLVIGTFVSSRLDGKKLPVADLATDSLGTQYLIEFAELVLAVNQNGEFRATLRYRQTLAAKGQRTSNEPLQRMTVYGTWTRQGAAVKFVPDPNRGGEGLRILTGTAAGKNVTVPFDYQNGRVTRHAVALLIYDPKII